MDKYPGRKQIRCNSALALSLVRRLVTDCYHSFVLFDTCFDHVATPVCLSLERGRLRNQAVKLQLALSARPRLLIPHAEASNPHGKPVTLGVHQPPPWQPLATPLSHLTQLCGMFSGP